MIWEMSFRLANVIVEEQSFEVLIPHYDRVDSFFYGDPPYYNSEYVYDAEFDWDHHVLLKETLLFLGMMTLSDNMLLGLGIMLAANEVPRIAQQFGLDSSVRVNVSSMIYSTNSAVNLARNIMKPKAV